MTDRYAGHIKHQPKLRPKTAAERLAADIRASGAEATVEVSDISEPGFPAFITCVYVEARAS